MPAQWPKFIKNVSDRMSSPSGRNNTHENFALFLANEYFNAVKTAQSPYGETHVSGVKTILDTGFVKGFNEIFYEEGVSLEDKFKLPRFEDFNEPVVVPNYSNNVQCEIENCINLNKDLKVSFIDYRKSSKPEKIHDYRPFQFFSLFESLCPIPFVEDEVDFTGGIDIEEFINNKLDEDQSIIDSVSPDLFATLTIYGFNESVDYKFLYSINGEDQPLERAEGGVFKTKIPTAVGEYTYVFKEVYSDGEDLSFIRAINKEAKVTIPEKGEPVIVNILEDESDQQPTTPKILDILNTDTLDLDNEEVKEYILNALTERLLLQNDGTKEYHDWVKSLKYRTFSGFPSWIISLSRIVYNRLEDIIDTVKDQVYEEIEDNITTGQQSTAFQNANNVIHNRFEIEEIRNNSKISKYVWQSNKKLDIDLPKWLDKEFIVAFTYDKFIDRSIVAQTASSSAALLAKTSKIRKYDNEEDLWFDRITACVSNKDIDKTQDDSFEDGYDTLAKSIVDYWKSCAIQPLSKSPPVPPCNTTVPLGGIYVPIYYGNQSGLANKLRRALNTGKKFGKLGLNHRPPSVAVATAIAAACSLHLLELKFIYLGGITTPTSPIPMIGFVPVVF